MITSLNFDWRFKENFDENETDKRISNAKLVDIPHNVKRIPLNYFGDHDFQGIFTYQKEFSLKVEPNKSYYIEFEGFMLQADIYLNGHNLGHFISGYFPVKIDITKYVDRKNYLTLKLDTNEDKNIPPYGLIVDYFAFGGIYRDVNLIIKDNLNIEDVFIKTKLTGEIDVDLTVNNPKSLQISTIFTVFDKDNNKILVSNNPTFIIENPHLWDIDDPYLYRLKVEIIGDDEKDSYETKFGIKESKFTPKGFFLNGKHIKLIGLNRHQVYPFVGYAAPRILQEEDALILKKDIGVNVVRCSHYPQSKYFMEKCDEIGLLTINEIPGWQFTSKEKAWRDNFIDFAERLVRKDRKYTSLIAYGVRIDESKDDHELYTKSNEIAHRLDPTRDTIGVRNFKGSECLEDVYGYNDFSGDVLGHGLDKPDYLPENKALLITEHNGHVFSTKPNDPQINRETQCLRHNTVINDAFSNERFSGALGWCFVDYYTHSNFGSGDHICYHGVMDINRNPKYAASIYKSQMKNTPVMDVLTNFDVGDHAANVPGKAYVATNCDYVKLYKNGEYVNTFYPRKDIFKFEPHPLIVLDDLLGNSFQIKGFNEKDRLFCLNTLNKARNNGWGSIKKLDYLKFGFLLKKYKMSMEEAQKIIDWNTMNQDPTLVYRLEGYIGNKNVLTKKVGLSEKYHLDIHTNYQKVILERGKFEIIPIKVEYLDEFENPAIYAQTVVKTSIKGSSELVSDDAVPLLGGRQTILVKFKEPGNNEITISVGNLTKKLIIEASYK